MGHEFCIISKVSFVKLFNDGLYMSVTVSKSLFSYSQFNSMLLNKLTLMDDLAQEISCQGVNMQPELGGLNSNLTHFSILP